MRTTPGAKARPLPTVTWERFRAMVDAGASDTAGQEFVFDRLGIGPNGRVLGRFRATGLREMMQHLKREKIDFRQRRANGLKDKFKFKAEMDEEARNHMFGHLKTKVA